MVGADDARPSFEQRKDETTPERARRRGDFGFLWFWLARALPFALFAMAYFTLGSLRSFVVARGVHVEWPYLYDKAVFGIGSFGERLSLNELFARHHWPVVDLITGCAYLSYIYVVLAFAAYLALVDGTRTGRQRARAIGWTFFGVNVAASVTYLLVPVAPPWYVSSHGFGPVDAATGGNPAALTRWDAMTGIPYFREFYSHATDVFGAMPSMHCAYPMLLLLYVRELGRPGLLVAMVAFWGLMCFSAVYLQHHYVSDVIVGTLYAWLGYGLERLLSGRRIGPDAEAARG